METAACTRERRVRLQLKGPQETAGERVRVKEKGHAEAIDFIILGPIAPFFPSASADFEGERPL